VLAEEFSVSVVKDCVVYAPIDTLPLTARVPTNVTGFVDVVIDVVSVAHTPEEQVMVNGAAVALLLLLIITSSTIVGAVFSCDNATNLTLTNPQTIQLSNATATTKVANGPTTGDTASNTFTISNGGAAGTAYDITGAFLDLSITGAAAKNISNQTRKIYGNWTDQASVTYTAGPLATTFAATTTGKTAAFVGTTADFPLIFNGVGGAWSLTWANVTTSVYSDITLTNGSLTFSGVNNFFKSLNSSNTNTRTLVLPSPGNTLTLSGTVPIDFTTSTNLTLTPGTGIVSCTNPSATFNGGGKTFATVNFTSTAISGINITGANTFVGLNITGRVAPGIGSLTLYANQTCTTINLDGGTDSRTRLFVKSDTLGVSRTLAVSSTKTITYVDFRDINASPAFTSTTNTGNCGGNTGITFTAAKTVYWSLAAGGDWGGTSWALTAGGAPGANNVPLAQDTANIVETGLTMVELKDYLLNEKQVNSVKICSLFTRPKNYKTNVVVDYVGIELTDVTLISYGPPTLALQT